MVDISWSIKKRYKERLARESGTIIKDPGGKVRVCLIYPNTYSVAMSNLGLHSVYALFNNDPRYLCERAFLPSGSEGLNRRDEAEEYVKSGTKLLSLESQSPVRDFDIIAFTASFEKDYVNIPAILKLAGVPVFSADRDEGHPLVIAGGCGVSLNPEPVAEMIDVFLLGEGEASVGPFMEVFEASRDCGAGEGDRDEYLKGFFSVPGAYVPAFYDFEYDDNDVNGKVVSISSRGGAPMPVRKAVIDNLSLAPMPVSVITTPDTSFSDTVLIEAERGCPRGCRFCSAGFIYLPTRWRSYAVVKEAIKDGLQRTGKVGLVGAAISEHPDLKKMLGLAAGKDEEITVSSLRADMIDVELLELLKEAGYKTITVAPEAGTERMRRVISKDIADDCLVECARLVNEAGIRRMKLYFMVGLPGETQEDVRAIAELTIRIKDELKNGSVAISINPFIPKPVTPFQWHGYEGAASIEKKYKIIKSTLGKVKGVSFKTESAKEAVLQAWLARADRRAGRVIVEAAGAGETAGVGEGVKIGLKRAVKALAPGALRNAERQRSEGEALPWDVVDHIVTKNYLWKEYKKGVKELV
ncbi:FIG092679: Fe-S oxidoreductase [hydrothermal vent metagenome]|uniref:FIG092679: Fe-S oxidoreductase n=1 Tax=hydrothermal vent metagenome TaxID=652676 RepID=A0A3B0QVF2_9ZZZZ